ncbi:hypothetical protein [Paenibacillus sp. 1781tsa1]|uniref:hypothetical protein n=1 Tax=Paenibacillus sp. 1781tsa1 TaxID=2953810 RepID=UPI0020A1CA64|nr:hypothetical protein [Paenibacillus sp. 1781tsa1]MCP1184943.1 hypothetical protein [Paenibacillus sp. 1781tsa1]
MFPELSNFDINNRLEVLRTQQRKINNEIAMLEEMKSRKLSEEYGKYTIAKVRKKDIYDPYPTVRF